MNIKKSLRRIKKHTWFRNCIDQYENLNKNNRFKIKRANFYKCLDDNTEITDFDVHYEYHQAWAARCLFKISPDKHIDISSRITFNVIISAFIPVEFYDYRPAEIYHLSGLECKRADLCTLDFDDNSIESLSCMHTVEHVGLGRYGDNIDPEGDLKAISELKRVVKEGGHLLFVVPVGRPRLEFNAHRIYSYEMIMEYFNDFNLLNFSLIPDNARKVGILDAATANEVNKQTYGCGCFWFQK